MSVLKSLPTSLRQKIRKYNVPGASLAILRGTRVVGTATAGVTSLDTGIKVTDQTLFQIGSITKTFTATLAMQLVDEGRLDLDAPVQTYLPDFRVADVDVSRAVTTRDFLSHQSGIDGDFFVDSGRGDDSGERLLKMASMMPSLFAPRTSLSYCNLGFVVVGRIIEVLTGMPWDDVMRKRIFEPLEMSHAFTRPEDAVRFSCAIGHVPSSRRKGKWYASKVPYLSMGQKAAGATPTMTATDLLKFVRAHLDNGRLPSGDKLLSAKSARAMRTRQVRPPAYIRPGLSGWGIGWMLFDWHGQKLFGHDGGTIGQQSFLRVLPAQNLAVVLLTNGGDMTGLADDMLDEVFGGLARTRVPDALSPDPAIAPDLSRYKGAYENIGGRFVFSEHDGSLTVEYQGNGGGSGDFPAGTPLAFAAKNVAVRHSGDPVLDRLTFVFSSPDAGGHQLVSHGTRQFRRVCT